MRRMEENLKGTEQGQNLRSEDFQEPLPAAANSDERRLLHLNRGFGFLHGARGRELIISELESSDDWLIV